MNQTLTLEEQYALIEDLRFLRKQFVDNVRKGVVKLTEGEYAVFKGRLDDEINKSIKSLPL